MATAGRSKRTPNLPGAQVSELHGVSCWSASRCIGVGDVTTSAGAVVALAELHT